MFQFFPFSSVSYVDSCISWALNLFETPKKSVSPSVLCFTVTHSEQTLLTSSVSAHWSAPARPIRGLNALLKLLLVTSSSPSPHHPLPPTPPPPKFFNFCIIVTHPVIRFKISRSCVSGYFLSQLNAILTHSLTCDSLTSGKRLSTFLRWIPTVKPAHVNDLLQCSC